MLFKAALVALVVTANAADTFIWNRNNDISNADNWNYEGDKTDGNQGVLNLNVNCINSWGEAGGQVRVDKSMVLSEMSLPKNGEVILAEGTSITFANDDAAKTQTWKCSVRDTACSANYVVVENGEYVPATKPPCYEDTLRINGSQAHSMSFAAHQHLKRFQVTAEDSADNMMYDSEKSAEFNALWSQSDRKFQGFQPELYCDDAATCAELCYDSCAPDVVHDPAAPDDFFLHKLELARVASLHMNLNKDALDALNAVDYGKELKKKADGMSVDGMTQSTETMSVSVSSANLADWVEDSKILEDRTQINTIRFSLTNEVAAKALGWLEGMSSSEQEGLWKEIDSSETESINRVEDSWDFFNGKNCKKNGLAKAVEGMETAAAGKFTLTLSNSEYTTVTVVPANAGEASDDSPGAFHFKNFSVATMYNDDGESVMTEEMTQMLFSSVVTKFVLYYNTKTAGMEVEALVAKINAKTLAPTVTPTSSPSMSPTIIELGLLEGANATLVFGGAGAGLLLIILIIVIICLSAGGSGNKGKPDETRNVVAFENPMYDDPAASKGMKNDASEDPGLYDEPSFNAQEKENPMYQSNENVESSGGYLDVEPDDDDDDEDEDEDE